MTKMRAERHTCRPYTSLPLAHYTPPPEIFRKKSLGGNDTISRHSLDGNLHTRVLLGCSQQQLYRQPRNRRHSPRKKQLKAEASAPITTGFQWRNVFSILRVFRVANRKNLSRSRVKNLRRCTKTKILLLLVPPAKHQSFSFIRVHPKRYETGCQLSLVSLHARSPCVWLADQAKI